MICCFKHKTAYEMLIRYWISDVCSSDLSGVDCDPVFSGCFAMSAARETLLSALDAYVHPLIGRGLVAAGTIASAEIVGDAAQVVIELGFPSASIRDELAQELGRSEEHTSELQSLMRISYAVFCLKKQKNRK